MIEMKNSELLEKIMDYAKRLCNGDNATVTAERFIVSVIDLVSGATGIDLADKEKEALAEILSKNFPRSNPGFADLKNQLLKRIEEVGDNSFIDGLYIQRQMYKAKETANRQKLDRLTPDTLLTCILENPNEYIKTCVLKSGNAEGEVNAQTAEKGAGAPGTVSAEDSKTALAQLTEKVKSMREALLQSVFGQDNAISVLTNGYFKAELSALTDKDRRAPRAVFLFAGSPGVGKTFLAEKTAEFLKLPFQRFDMSEYSDHQSAIDFAGSNKVYGNSSQGNATSFVQKHPKCIMLFDEIEKAHINVIHLFLQILDAGCLRDSNTNTEISFKDAILIFTTNAGRSLYENSETIDFSDVNRKVIIKALQSDIDPITRTPYFPAALCSRFSSGNVVMFNHISAHNLREIAKREVLRHVANFENSIGIHVDIDESVYTTLLFAEGGAADARMVKGRASAFFDDELFELFRLMDSKTAAASIETLDTIRFTLDLPTGNAELRNLYCNDAAYKVLVCSSRQTCGICAQRAPSTEFICAESEDAAKAILRDMDINFVLIDLSFGVTGDPQYLNIEDVDSKARNVFWLVREKYANMPVYLLQTAESELNPEERLSFLKQGARGFLSLAGDDFADEIAAANEKLHQQRSVARLAGANKVVTFETAQLILDEGKTAEIRLFDFELTNAVDAEDSQNIMSNVSKPDVKFDDIIGAEDAKKELRFFIDYLKNPKQFAGRGLKMPRGVLLYGPPGTGKTMLAKAVAAEAGVTFISAEGNQFLKKYVGEGKDKLHELFSVARKYSPSILFIDEFEAIAQERRGGDQPWGKGEDVLTALLTEMDGFHTSIAKPVFVLAATNFDVKPGSGRSLDQALLRRFDRRICVDLPNKEERIRFMRKRCENGKAFEISDSEIENIALRSTGMSLADLESIFEQSLRIAIAEPNKKVTDAVLDEAFEIFLGGEEKKWDASQLERTARHEAGHAYLCWQSGETPSYITIVARDDHGGYMMHGADEGKQVYTKDELLARIRTSLGGRAAEIVYYGEKDGLSTGASADLASATALAKQIVCCYGMEPQFGLAVIDPREAGSALSHEVREAINRILADEMQNAIRLIQENRAAIDALVGRLLVDNHLIGVQIAQIFEGAK